jgi:hypothetical protein
VQAKHRTHLVGAAQLELAQTTPLFDPTKHLLDTAVGIDRLGLALSWRLVFCATCGVTAMRRISAVMPVVS